jgi:hypothetical protein
MRKITGLLAASVLFVAACGDDDDDTAGGVQNDAADELVQQMEDEDIDADESCVREAFADMSDEDAQKIVDAGSDETPDLSPEGLAIATQATTSCVSGEDLLDSFIESLPENVDGDCVRETLEGVDFDFSELMAGNLPPEVEQAMDDCGTG